MGSLQPTDPTKSRYPQLVSFIGVTNAGKSTIIKMLVNHIQLGEGGAQLDFPTPVVGSMANDKVIWLPSSSPVRQSSLHCLL